MNTISHLKIPIFIILGALVIGSGFFAYALLPHTQSVQGATVSVGRMDLDEVVQATGEVKAAQDISLSFERSGTVTSVRYDVGQTVHAGNVIATLSGQDLQAQLLQAQAALDTQQIKLTKIQTAQTAGAPVSDIQTNITNNQANVADKLTDAYFKTDTVIGTFIDTFFQNPKTNPTYGLITTSGSSQFYVNAPYDVALKLQNERGDLNAAMVTWNTENQTLTTDAGITAADQTGEDIMQKVQTLLTDLASALNTYAIVDASQQPILATYKQDIASSRATIDASLSALRTANQQYASAKSSVSPYELQLQQTAVENAQASVDSIMAQINKGTIIAPIDGVITEQDAKIGQVAAPDQPMVQMISTGKFQIDAYVSEADISKIAVGQTATVTLDAALANASSTAYSAQVLTIDPAPTVQNGINAYKVTLQFNQDDSILKPGLTAEVAIHITSHPNVIAVPDQSIIRNNDTKYVVKNVDGTSQQVEVQTGVTGSNGYTEITSGLNEGDQIYTFGK